MKHIFLMILLVAFFSGCTMIYFKSPMPAKGKVIKTFRNEVQGTYDATDLQVKLFENRVEVNGVVFKLTSEIKTPDEVVVKFYKNNYFVSFLDQGNYLVFMAKFYDDKLALYDFSQDDYSIYRMNKLVGIYPVQETNHALFELSKKEFDLLIEYECYEVLSVLTKSEANE